jgi:hypothetical protein
VQVVNLCVSFIFFKESKPKPKTSCSITYCNSCLWWISLVCFKSRDSNQESISWEGHLAGLISVVSLITPQLKKTIKYDWEHPDFDPSQDKFMQFDENGNFVNLPVVV